MRVSVWNAAGSRRLESKEGLLPQLQIEGASRAQPAVIVEKVRRKLGLSAAFLRVESPSAVEVEYAGSEFATPSGLRWCTRTMSPPIAERPPWQRPGWLAQTTSELDQELATLCLERVGDPIQVRHTSVTGMLRVQTDRQPVWLKAVPSMFEHEGRLVRCLEHVAPHSVPTVLAVTPNWWLSGPFPEAQDSPLGDPLVSLARVQVEVASRVDELRTLGCPDRPLNALAGEVARLVDRPDLIGPEEREQLAAGLGRLADACAEVDGLGVPVTLIHGDLNPTNVRWTRYGWFIFDWTDACVAHPLIDLAWPLCSETTAIGTSRARTYAGVWASVLDSRTIERALHAAPLIGPAHQAISYRSIIDGIDRSAADQASGEQMTVLLQFWVRRLLDSLALYCDGDG